METYYKFIQFKIYKILKLLHIISKKQFQVLSKIPIIFPHKTPHSYASPFAYVSTSTPV